MLKILFNGNVARDPRMVEANGSKFCTFAVAVNYFAKGEKRVEFIDVAVFGKRGDICAQYLAKGSKVAVCGDLRRNEYTTANGEKRVSFSCTNAEVDFMGGKAETAEPAPEQPAAWDELKPDDIPF